MWMLKTLGLIILAPLALLVTCFLVLDLTGQIPSDGMQMTVGGYIAIAGLDALSMYGIFRLFRSLHGKEKGPAPQSGDFGGDSGAVVPASPDEATRQAHAQTRETQDKTLHPDGEKRGFFQNMRDKLERKKAMERATADIGRAIASSLYIDDLPVITSAIASVASSRNLDSGMVREAVAACLGNAVDKALHDGILREKEEKQLFSLMDQYGLSMNEMPQDARERLSKATVIRELLEGTVKPREEIADMPFTLAKNEMVIWTFRNARAYEHETGYRYEGGSHGASIRVVKGLYRRMGNFAGRRAPVKQRNKIGNGTLAITNRNLFFMSGTKTLRISHDKMISITPTGNSVLVGYDLARSHTLEFETDDNRAFADILGNAQNGEEQ